MKINNIKKRTQIQGGVLWTIEIDNEKPMGENLKTVITITKEEANQLFLMGDYQLEEYPTPGYRIMVWTAVKK